MSENKSLLISKHVKSNVLKSVQKKTLATCVLNCFLSLHNSRANLTPSLRLWQALDLHLLISDQFNITTFSSIAFLQFDRR